LPRLPATVVDSAGKTGQAPSLHEHSVVVQFASLLKGHGFTACGKTHECADHRGRAALQGRVSPVKSARALALVVALSRPIAFSAASSAVSLASASYFSSHLWPLRWQIFTAPLREHSPQLT